MRTSIEFVFVAIFLGVLDASASSISFNRAVANECLGTLGGPDCGIDRQQVIVLNGTASLDGTFGSAEAGAQMTANVSATSSYGVLHASSSSTMSLTGSPRVAAASGAAIFEDTLTINFDPLTGSQGTLYVNYNLDGTIADSGVDKSFLEVFIEVGPTLAQQYATVYTSSTAGLVAVPQAFTFTYGQPFGLMMEILAITSTGPDFVIGTGTATTDFSNTLVLSGLIVEDQNGNPVPGATFNSFSGTAYSSQGVVPEPSTAFLAFSALVLIWIRTRKHGLQL